MPRDKARRDALTTQLRDGATLVSAVAGWHVALHKRLAVRDRRDGLERYEVFIYNGLLCRWKLIRWKRTAHAALTLASTLYAVPDGAWDVSDDVFFD